jgi:ferredoxin
VHLTGGILRRFSGFVYTQAESCSLGNGYASVDAAACMGCGVCVSQCPEEAISLLRDPAKGEPLEIHKLMARAAESAPG